MSGLKKYEQIVKAITDGIVSGKYIPLGPIPSERALMMRFKTARDTVRKALSVLDAQRMIYRRPGRVTVVSDRVLKSRMKIGVMISGCTFTEIFRSICDAVKEFAALNVWRWSSATHRRCLWGLTASLRCWLWLNGLWPAAFAE